MSGKVWNYSSSAATSVSAGAVLSTNSSRLLLSGGRNAGSVCGRVGGSQVATAAAAAANTSGSISSLWKSDNWQQRVLQLQQKAAAATATNNTGGFPETADVVIIGGGITGSSLLYELAEFTDLSRVVLIERRDEFARVASGPNNNSQTIHCGDIETNYTPQKAASVQRYAHMLRNFATKLPPNERDRCIGQMQKMAIGVGDKECALMEDRYQKLKPIFKRLQLLNKKQIAQVEPAIVYSNLTTRQERPENVVAHYVPDEHTAVDYFYLTNNLIRKAQENRGSRDIRAFLGTEMWDIHKTDKGWRVWTNKGPIDTKFLVVSACGYSLLIAHRLGFGRQFSCLPVAGSYYFGPQLLKGKVYTVQNPVLPFAAVHGDPDMVFGRKTRFGPTALPLPVLERYRWSTMLGFLEVLKPNAGLVRVFYDLFKNRTIRNYMLKNILFEVPFVNDRLFLNDVKKIAPSLKLSDLKYAHGFGGVRPQLVDKVQRKLLLGEGKISPENESVIFNITPSPGGTTCMGNAEGDMKKIVAHLGCSFDEKRFKSILLDGEYPVE